MADASKLFQGDKYKPGNSLFPSDEIAPIKKRKGETSKQFCLAFAKAFYWGWGNGNFAYSRFSDRDKMIMLRNYARGRQSIDTYYDFWYGRNDSNQIIRKGYMNINWDVLAVALKFKDRFVAALNEIEYDPVISSQDQYSRDEKKEKQATDYVKNKLKHIFPQPDKEENNMAPDTLEEFEILEQMGVYKNKAEYAWEKLIYTTFQGFNNWDLKLKNKLIDDIFSLGRCCVRDYVDPDTQTIKVEYVDPVNTIIRLTTDGEVIDGGFIDLMTVQDLKKASGLDETTLFSIAKNACGWYGNPYSHDTTGWPYGASYQDWLGTAVPRTSVGNCEWYSFRVPVLKCEYRSVDTDFYTEQDLGEEKKYTRAKYGKVFTSSPTRKTIQKNTINYYTCSWIIGTDHCYDYGLQYDMPRVEKAEAKCSFHFRQSDDPSIMERLKPAVDLTLNAWYAFQNGIAKSRPSGNLYDMSALKNANVGDKMTPAKIIQGINQTGSGIFSSLNKRGDRPVIAPNVGPPVIPLTGGYEDAARDFATAWSMMSTIMHDLAGMTPSFVGDTTNLPEGKAVNEGQSMASASLLQPKIDIYRMVRSSCALNILLRGQVIFRHNEEITDQYKQILGEDIVEILKISAQKNYAQYGMSMTLRISAPLKAEIKQVAIAASQPGKNGEPGLSFPEFMKVLDMLSNNTDITYIQSFIARLINKRKEQEQLVIMQNQDNQNKGLKEMEAQKAQAAMELLKFQTDQEITKNVVIEAAKAHFAKEAAATGAEQQLTNDVLNTIMEGTLQQYASGMGMSK